MAAEGGVFLQIHLVGPVDGLAAGGEPEGGQGPIDDADGMLPGGPQPVIQVHDEMQVAVEEADLGDEGPAPEGALLRDGLPLVPAPVAQEAGDPRVSRLMKPTVRESASI